MDGIVDLVNPSEVAFSDVTQGCDRDWRFTLVISTSMSLAGASETPMGDRALQSQVLRLRKFQETESRKVKFSFAFR
jgi:hypothetical protein